MQNITGFNTVFCSYVRELIRLCTHLPVSWWKPLMSSVNWLRKAASIPSAAKAACNFTPVRCILRMAQGQMVSSILSVCWNPKRLYCRCLHQKYSARQCAVFSASTKAVSRASVFISAAVVIIPRASVSVGKSAEWDRADPCRLNVVAAVIPREAKDSRCFTVMFLYRIGKLF